MQCCADAPSVTNFLIPSLTAAGTHCPIAAIPDSSETVFDPETGRAELYFYDVAYGGTRGIILNVNDPACFESRAMRRALFAELQLGISIATGGGDYRSECERLREAILHGSVKLGSRPFDLRPAQPYVSEVCAG